MTSTELKQAGLKVTLPRMKVLDLLREQSDKHLSAEDVYKYFLNNDEEVGLATVYRVLTQFEDAGLVKRHNFENGQSVFEIDDGKHHDHLVCVHCGDVVEFYDDAIEQRQTAVAKKKGFKLLDHSLVLYGECNKKQCRGR